MVVEEMEEEESFEVGRFFFQFGNECCLQIQ